MSYFSQAFSGFWFFFFYWSFCSFIIRSSYFKQDWNHYLFSHHVVALVIYKVWIRLHFPSELISVTFKDNLQETIPICSALSSVYKLRIFQIYFQKVITITFNIQYIKVCTLDSISFYVVYLTSINNTILNFSSSLVLKQNIY